MNRLVLSAGTETILVSSPEHAPLVTSLLWRGPVILRAPKKVGALVSVSDVGGQVAYTFQGKQRVPALSEVRLHVKPVTQKPLVLRIHEVVGVAA